MDPGIQKHSNRHEDDDRPKTDPEDVLLLIRDNLPELHFDSSTDFKKVSSQPNINESYAAPLLHKSISEQDLRKLILLRGASSIVSTVVSSALFYNIWITLLPLQKQNVIWMAFLELFGFMLFVSAVVVMILLGGVFTSMQKAMLIILLLWIHIQSANSIVEVCLILLGGLFMVWFAFLKKELPSDESDIKSSNMLDNTLSAQTIV